MPRKDSYLTRQETEDLVKYVAGTGENYQRYLHWCDERMIPEDRRFTAQYFHRWVHRKKPKVWAAKAQNQAAIREAATLHKNARVAKLQQSVERLERELERLEGCGHECESCGQLHITNTDTVLKVEEQIRKTMESIAKELGEFNKPPDEKPDAVPLEVEMAALLHRFTQKPQPLIEAVAIPVEG